jgi:hypothetical protein
MTKEKNKFYRFEFKYQIKDTDVIAIEHDLKKMGFELDPHLLDIPGNSYPVTSLYFDSPQIEDYYDKSAGLLRRKKVRARIYKDYLDDTVDYIWLEIKRKHGATVFKKRVKLSHTQWEEFSRYGGRIPPSGEFSQQEQEILDEIIWNINDDISKPVAFVRYKRRPYILKGTDLRVTFDYEIETCHKKDLCYPTSVIPVGDGVTVMELKFNRQLPHWINFIIRKHNLTYDQFSKYARSMEAIYRYDPLPR